MNDGDNTFDGPANIHANRICEDLIRRRELRPIIIVAISQVSHEQRYIDYMPWRVMTTRPNGYGEFYVRALRDTLKPEIDRRYRTLSDPLNTAIGGMSLSGLLAAYAGFAHSETFGKVAAFSPTYAYGWWNFQDLVDSLGRPRLYRLYQDTGYPDDNDIYWMEGFAYRLGFTAGMDFMSQTAVGADHSVAAWRHRFGGMLKFLFTPNVAIDPPQ